MVRAVAAVWVPWLLVGSLVWVIEHIVEVEILHGSNGRIKPSLCIKGRHGVVAFEFRRSLCGGISGSVDGIVEGILAESNGVLEAVCDAGPDVLGGSFDLVDVGLRLLLDGKLLHYLLIREDEGSGDGRKRQNSSEELHIEDI